MKSVKKRMQSRFKYSGTQAFCPLKINFNYYFLRAHYNTMLLKTGTLGSPENKMSQILLKLSVEKVQ